MTFAKNIGCIIKIDSELSMDKTLFSETGGFVLEVSSENLDEIKSVFSKYGLDVFKIGSTGGNTIKINNALDLSVKKANKAWTNGLRNKL